MTSEQKAAYVIAQAACASAAVAGMSAENQWRAHRGEAPAYTEAAFQEVPREYGLHHNDVLALFQA